MTMSYFSVILFAGLVLLPVHHVWAQPSGPRTVSATATLNILAGTVQHVPNGTNQPQPAKDGMTVAVGDRVLTGPKTFAVVTFLDGSTLEVCPNSDVAIKAVEISPGKSSTINIRINFGLVWVRVVKLLDPKATFSLEANTVRASVHDGLIGARQNTDGSFECWTQAGTMLVEDKFDSKVKINVTPGHRVKFEPGMPPPVQQPFASQQSTVRITASPTVLPLVLIQDKARVAGFVAPGVEINQVLSSFTGVAADGTHTVEIPAGVAGPFLLAVEGVREGPFKIIVTGLFKGEQVYQQELSGTIRKGERLTAEIAQQMDPAAGDDPKTARVHSGRVAPLQSLSGPLPGTIVLSAEEVKQLAGM